MNASKENAWLAGVDGCPGGWLAVFARPDGEVAQPRIVTSFAEIIRASERPQIIAIDIPIGLPKLSPAKGRLAESAVRPLLGERKSSVFRIPSRRAVYASVAAEPADERARFFQACQIARETSEDGKAFAKQGFYILDKVVEVDRYLRAHPHDAARVFETHPEVAFWRMNSDRPLSQPKKIKNRAYQPGLDQRRELLRRAGIPAHAIDQRAPAGASEDDLVDALACTVVARRIHENCAKRFPEAAPHDEFGLPMAIWA
jgi:predicted RNase H-like nuclease